MIVMGIESSCDETGVGIVRWRDSGVCELLADEVASSVDEHARYGGVVPEVASRAHLEAMVPTMRRALAAADIDRPDAVAVTIGPGLAGALLVRLPLPRPTQRHGTSPSTPSIIWAATSRSTPSSTVRCRRAWHFWSPADILICCTSTICPSPSRSWVPLSTTRPVRRSTRWPACSVWATRAVRRSTMRRAKAIRLRLLFPAE